LDWDLDELMRSGERAWNLKRRINLNLGLLGANDCLPAPMLKALPNGGAEGYIIPFDEMLAAYYIARGWGEDGVPLREKMDELNLGSL
jgi:aldehyde:ferredoxin oxidoreductase